MPCQGDLTTNCGLHLSAIVQDTDDKHKEPLPKDRVNVATNNLKSYLPGCSVIKPATCFG